MSGKYIVVFKDTASDSDIQKYVDDVNNNGGSIGHRYDATLKGFSASIPDAYFQQFQSQGLQGGVIDYIEPDGIVTTQ